MINEENEVTTMSEEMSNNQYIDAIKELKATTVSKDKFNELKAENSKLLQSLMNGETIEAKVSEQGISREALDANLVKKGIPLLDSITSALKLRDKVIEEDGKDPFDVHGYKSGGSYESKLLADRAYQGLSELVEMANGDADYFNSLISTKVNWF